MAHPARLRDHPIRPSGHDGVREGRERSLALGITAGRSQGFIIFDEPLRIGFSAVLASDLPSFARLLSMLFRDLGFDSSLSLNGDRGTLGSRRVK